MKRKPSRSNTMPRDRGDRGDREKPPVSLPSFLNITTMAILAAVFVVGIGVGIAFTSTTTLNPENVASSQTIDRSAPSTELCIQYGASAMVTDMRVFLTLNPFNVYVTQPSLRPGCVLRQNNWSILEQRKLVTSQQVNDCKRRMNTFGFTGNLDSSPDIRCIYQNEAAQNYFITQPGAVGPKPETNNF